MQIQTQRHIFYQDAQIHKLIDVNLNCLKKKKYQINITFKVINVIKNIYDKSCNNLTTQRYR